MTISQSGDPLETEVKLRWQKVFGEPLPITGGLDLALGILRDFEDKAADEAERSNDS